MAVWRATKGPMPVCILEDPLLLLKLLLPHRGEFLYAPCRLQLCLVLPEILALLLDLSILAQRLHRAVLDTLPQFVEDLELCRVKPGHLPKHATEPVEFFTGVHEGPRESLLNLIIIHHTCVPPHPLNLYIGILNEDLVNEMLLNHVAQQFDVEIQITGTRGVREDQNDVVLRLLREDGADLGQHIAQLRGHFGLSATDYQTNGMEVFLALNAVHDFLRILPVDMHAPGVSKARRVDDAQQHAGELHLVRGCAAGLAHHAIFQLVLKLDVVVRPHLSPRCSNAMSHHGRKVRHQVQERRFSVPCLA
mmetsp:Transcript_34943/g.76275  ORF Transcript_34943/g.76275 Transcript_34943/m.76275 type:complete len:306 (+) Transcript_34943:217-1134(+)